MTIELDVTLHQPVRTRIAAFLVTRGSATFVELKQALEVTDGNLDAHLKKLLAADYVRADKSDGSEGRVQTTFAMTRKGEKAF